MKPDLSKFPHGNAWRRGSLYIQISETAMWYIHIVQFGDRLLQLMIQ